MTTKASKRQTKHRRQERKTMRKIRPGWKSRTHPQNGNEASAVLRMPLLSALNAKQWGEAEVRERGGTVWERHIQTHHVDESEPVGSNLGASARAADDLLFSFCWKASRSFSLEESRRGTVQTTRAKAALHPSAPSSVLVGRVEAPRVCVIKCSTNAPGNCLVL